MKRRRATWAHVDRLKVVVRQMTFHAYQCRRCGERAHPYMVRPELWKKHGVYGVKSMRPKPLQLPKGVLLFYAPDAPHDFGGHLCIPCLEHRMKRPLARKDLDPTQPINSWLRWRRGRVQLQLPCGAWELIIDAITPEFIEGIWRRNRRP